MDPQDFLNKFKLSKLQFLTWAASCRDIVIRRRELDYLAQGLLFLHKILNNESFSSLAVDFVLPKKEVRRIFWKVLMHQYQHNINVPRLMFNHSTVDDQVNRLLTESFISTPPLIQNIFRHFVDLSGRGRIEAESWSAWSQKDTQTISLPSGFQTWCCIWLEAGRLPAP